MTSGQLIDYLARQWRPGEYDCWHLVRDLYRDQFGVELPAAVAFADDTDAVLEEFASSPIRRLFQSIDAPEHGCVVGFAKEGALRHVGVAFDLGGEIRILHLHRTGAAFETPRSIRNYQLSYYRYAARGLLPEPAGS